MDRTGLNEDDIADMRREAAEEDALTHELRLAHEEEVSRRDEIKALVTTARKERDDEDGSNDTELDSLWAAVHLATDLLGISIDPGPEPRQDADGQAYLAYFDKDTSLGFCWDGSSGRIEISKGGMGEPVVDWCGAPDPSFVSFDAVLATFRIRCEEYVVNFADEPF